jgi:hypothetical protein
MGISAASKITKQMMKMTAPGNPIFRKPHTITIINFYIGEAA